MDTQTIIALLIVGACALYVARAWLRAWFGEFSPACGGCGGCHSEVAPEEPAAMTREIRQD